MKRARRRRVQSGFKFSMSPSTELGTSTRNTAIWIGDYASTPHPHPSPGKWGNTFRSDTRLRLGLPPAKREKNEENNGSSHQQPLCAASHPRSSLLAGPETRLSADGTSFSQWPNSQASSSSFDRVPKTGVACCAHTLSGFISQFCDLLRFFWTIKG